MENEIRIARLKYARIFLVLLAVLYQYLTLNAEISNFLDSVYYFFDSSVLLSLYLTIEIELGRLVTRSHFIFCGLENGAIFIRRLKFTLWEKKFLLIVLVYYAFIFLNRHIDFPMACMIYLWGSLYACLVTMIIFTAYDLMEKWGLTQYLLALPIIARLLIDHFAKDVVHFLFLPNFIAENYLNEHIILIATFSMIYFLIISFTVLIVQTYFIRFGYFK